MAITEVNVHMGFSITHRIHGAAIYGNMDPIHIPQMLAYIPYMDPIGKWGYIPLNHQF